MLQNDYDVLESYVLEVARGICSEGEATKGGDKSIKKKFQKHIKASLRSRTTDLVITNDVL